MNKKYINNNALSSFPTRFLAGIQLIAEAREMYHVPSENWTYPFFNYGQSDDKYYAELWSDGMDWNYNVWVIESVKYGDPVVTPFMNFERGEEYEKFNNYDLKLLYKEALRYRRSTEWLVFNDNKKDWDSEIMHHIHKIDHPSQSPINMLFKYYIEHNSQKRVEFWMNQKFLPGLK